MFHAAKKKGLAAFWILCFSFLIINQCFASYNCDCNIPEWFFQGYPQCPISPYYYKAEIDASENGYNSQYPPAWSASGWCTEYWPCIDCWDPRLSSCKESTYSDPNDDDNIYCSLFMNGACYGWMYYDPWFWDTANVEGSWNDKVFTGSTSYNWDDPNGPNYHNYESSIIMTAEFNRGNVPAECLIEPKIEYSNYEKTMVVRPKNRCCCPPSQTQTIGISCVGASHSKTTMNISGDAELIVLDPNETDHTEWEKGCDNTRCSGGGGWIKIVPNHDKVMITDRPKNATVNYQVDFYDSAGNYLTQGSINVNLTTECPKQPN